ncbi:hypothetical protein [Rubellimicrobium aerolatum]|uniref:Uncharacterized protein n=1 Tax=Rubellimicrobium aerolatum TaxID=490979 RepID=A0ABW0SER2_9RHOB|nr:hypothetical protein [Rubellimicrobium aerolatum]MBP1806461.1 hypothetical protein [Rubellimicrobium aerolatum]
MIRLNLSAAPRWIDLGRGVRVEVEPLGSFIDLAARAELPVIEPDQLDLPTLIGRNIAHAKAVARRAIRAWEGVADETGADLPVSGPAIDALLEQHTDLYVAFARDYVRAGAALVAEGNVSTPSPAGTSAGAETTAAAATASATAALPA